MIGSQTIYLDQAKLLRGGKDAVKVVRLAICTNDIAVSNMCLLKCKEDSCFPARTSNHGAAMYFVRLQCGHLVESLKILDDVDKSTYLKALIHRLPPDAHAAYDRLRKCSTDLHEKEKFQQFITKVRDKFTFHYDDSVVKSALGIRAVNPRESTAEAVRGTDMSRWRFAFADDLVDTIMCRNVWQIPQGSNLQEEADKCSDYGYELGKTLLCFAGEFIWRYLDEHARAI